MVLGHSAKQEYDQSLCLRKLIHGTLSPHVQKRFRHQLLEDRKYEREPHHALHFADQSQYWAKEHYRQETSRLTHKWKLTFTNR